MPTTEVLPDREQRTHVHAVAGVFERAYAEGRWARAQDLLDELQRVLDGG